MITYDLFSYSNAGCEHFSEIDIPDAEVFLYPSLLSNQEADQLFDTLKKSIIWEQHKIKLYGEVHDVPRLTAWYGDPNKSYEYSGIKLKTRLWNAGLLKIREKIETISKRIYRADEVLADKKIRDQLRSWEDQGYGDLPICMAKTQYSISHDPALKGNPTGFTVPIREVRASIGAGFLYPLLGTMSTMPGLPTRPCFVDVDIDPVTEEITGLF